MDLVFVCASRKRNIARLNIDVQRLLNSRPMSQGNDILGANTELLTFDGSDTSDVTVLLQNVKRVAFSQGRQHDDQWLMDYTEISLTGTALRWFHELDEQSLHSWRALRGAFLLRFGSYESHLASAPAPDPAAVTRSAIQPLPNVPPPSAIQTRRGEKFRKVSFDISSDSIPFSLTFYRH